MRILLPLAILLPLGACAGLTGGDPALYQSLAESDVQLASRTMQARSNARRMAPRGRGRTSRPATGGLSRRPAPTSATAALSAANTARSWWSGNRAAASITPPAVTRTRVGYGSESHGGGRGA